MLALKKSNFKLKKKFTSSHFKTLYFWELKQKMDNWIFKG